MQHVLEATTESNILDLILTSDENVIEDLKVIEPIGNSHHNTILCKFLCANLMYESCNKSNRNMIDFKHSYNVNINRIVNEIDWYTEFDGKDIDGQWKSFCDIVLNACDGNAAPKRIKHKCNQSGLMLKPRGIKKENMPCGRNLRIWRTMRVGKV